MPKHENQKLKLLYLHDLLHTETDETHSLSMHEILEKLAEKGISAERKSVYDDLLALERYGLDILRSRDNVTRYSLAYRTFALPELKLLVDAVQSSKFLSAKKSRALIGKIESLASRHEASSLQRQVYVTHRIKSMNESVYYGIDALHAAIGSDCQITFQYFEWTMQKTQQFKHEGRCYQVSPYALLWDDENYYLVAFDAKAGIIKHYRVDKMHAIALCTEKRMGKELFESFDMARYAQATFGMFGGTEQSVELVFSSRLAGVVLDRFGKEIMLLPVDDGHFKICIKAVVSPQFMGWVAGFGPEVRITAPQSVADSFAEMCRNILRQYE